MYRIRDYIVIEINKTAASKEIGVSREYLTDERLIKLLQVKK